MDTERSSKGRTMSKVLQVNLRTVWKLLIKLMKSASYVWLQEAVLMQLRKNKALC